MPRGFNTTNFCKAICVKRRVLHLEVDIIKNLNNIGFIFIRLFRTYLWCEYFTYTNITICNQIHLMLGFSV